MKPLLLIPPAAPRWPGIEKLLTHEKPEWRADLRERIAAGLPGAKDACAIIPEGGAALAFAVVRRRGEVAVLSHVFTHPEHRRRGYARGVLHALLDWFELTGGKWHYLSCEPPMRAFYESLGFQVVHEARSTAEDSVLLRTAKGAAPTPLDATHGPPELRDIIWSDWPQLVALLQHRAGPDPRAPIVETALSAAQIVFEMLQAQTRGACRLIAESRDGRITAFASVATDQVGVRTYALLAPPDATHLREPVIRLANAIGYAQVDFPMELFARP